MRKLIWKSSVFAFVPVAAGLVALPILGGEGWWSLAAGGAFAAIAFGSFLEIAQNAGVRDGVKGILPVVLPVAALIAVGFLGAVSLDLLSRQLLRPETFVSGVVSGTLFSQFALVLMSHRLPPLRD